jgi:membrane protease YdiL (CAAX protease family)
MRRYQIGLTGDPVSSVAVPAVVVISALWAISHVQYNWFSILQIFLLGLVLGWARWRSGSTMLTFAMHALNNTWAMVETHWLA